PTTPIYALSLHDALPICERDNGDGLRNKYRRVREHRARSPQHAGDHYDPAGKTDIIAAALFQWPVAAARDVGLPEQPDRKEDERDRKSTRLNSSHVAISY